MAGEIWAIGEIADGAPTSLTRGLATLARSLAEAEGRRATSVLVGVAAEAAGQDLAKYGTDVLAVVSDPGDRPLATHLAECVLTLVREREPSYLLVGASQDGQDLAGLLQGLLNWGILVNSAGLRWTDGGPEVEMGAFGGRLVTWSGFTENRGIIVVRQSALNSEVSPEPGCVERVLIGPTVELPKVRLVERVLGPAGASSIEEAAIIVAGGRGVGSSEGFEVIRDLAEALDGAVGASRAAVDSGWIGYAYQIGQTGKTVKPELYLAAGISGAIQHKVGMQQSGTIVAINKDSEAPIAEFADLLVVNDLFEVLPRLARAVRARRG